MWAKLVLFVTEHHNTRRHSCKHCQMIWYWYLCFGHRISRFKTLSNWMGQKDKVKIFKLLPHLEAATFQGFPKKRVGSPRFMELQISNTLQKVHISAMMSAHNNCTNKNGTKHNKYQQHTLHKEWPTDSSSNKVSFVQISDFCAPKK